MSSYLELKAKHSINAELKVNISQKLVSSRVDSIDALGISFY